MASWVDHAWVTVSVLACKWLTEPLFHGFEGPTYLLHGCRGRNAHFHLPESRHEASCNSPPTAFCLVLTPLVVSFYDIDIQFSAVCSWARMRRAGSELFLAGKEDIGRERGRGIESREGK